MNRKTPIALERIEKGQRSTVIDDDFVFYKDNALSMYSDII